MARKCEHKELTVKEVFGLDPPGSVFVKEFLLAFGYGLLHRTAVAARAGFKYVWTRSGAICVRETDGSPVIFIKTEADFVNLKLIATDAPNLQRPACLIPVARCTDGRLMIA